MEETGGGGFSAGREAGWRGGAEEAVGELALSS